MSSWLYAARVTVETTAPLSIAGERDPRYDVTLRRDANGLPALPGSSLAGVLRAAYAERCGADAAAALFGSDRPTKLGARGRPDNSLIRSPLTVTWGVCHDAQDRPVDGLMLTPEQQKRLEGPVMARLRDQQPMRRDHVRLNHRGAPDGRGKYDRGAVPIGARFTFDLIVEHPKDDNALTPLLQIIADGGLRLGGASRNGYGGLRLVRLRRMACDLSTEAGRATWAAWPVKLEDQESKDEEQKDEEPKNANQALLPADPAALLSLHLSPVDFWRVGGGVSDDADQAPVKEPCILWGADNKASLSEKLVVPASSIKGPLRQRTAFHLNILKGHWAEDVASADAEPPELAELFGAVKEDGGGRAGRLVIDDVRLDAAEPQLRSLTHNAIDRFSGGTVDGVLFVEELVWRGDWLLRLRLREKEKIPDLVRQAFRRALEDLANGDLGVGAGWAKGHGALAAKNPDELSAVLAQISEEA